MKITIIYFVNDYITVFHQNINGLINKSDQLTVCIDDLRSRDTPIDILCITEHNMICGDEQFLSIPNFILASSYMRDSRHGGCCILVKISHKFKELSNIKSSSIMGAIEFSAVELIDHKMCIICVYRAPKTNSCSYNIFFNKLNDVLLQITRDNKQIILCGDFNIDMLKNDRVTREFSFLLSSFNLETQIKEPTRIVSNTCIDNFAHNIKKCKSKILDIGLSDHTAQILSCPVNKSSRLTFWYTMKRDYSVVNRQKFLMYLNQLTFYDVYKAQDPNESFDFFYDWFRLLYDLCFPYIRIRITNEIKPKWISRGIKICSKRKTDLLWKYRTCPNAANKSLFMNYHKKYKQIIKLTKKSQNNYYINNSSNKSKATWAIINNKRNRIPLETVPTLKIGGVVVSDPGKVATSFNDYFIDMAKSKKNYKANLTFNNSKSIFMSPTIPLDIHKIIMSLKNTESPGHDGIITKIIKESCTLISPVISHIINLCIEKGIFPQQLKTAVIKPLFKKGDKSDINNYRPIALLPVLSKIFEKVIYNSLYSFLEANKILTPEQFGFKKNTSINMAIYNLLSEVMLKMDKRIPIVSLYMDLTKAFDHVDHDILLDKLFKYGIRGNAHDLIRSYLIGRDQYTEVNCISSKTKYRTTYKSEHKIIKYGVPQGSVLGPLLFIIYVNDLPKVVNNKMTLFADDTTVLFHNKDINNLVTDINSSLTCIIKWLECNNLNINLDKTKVMNFKQRNNGIQKLHISYSGKQIDEINTIKFLGLYLDSDMKWKSHIDYVCKKLSKFAFALRMLRKVVNTNTLLTAYHGCVSSTLRYGIIFWGNSVHKDLAFRAQKKCVRSISNIKQIDSCKPHFIKLGLLTLPCLYILESCIFIKANLNLYSFNKRVRHNDKLCSIFCNTHLYKQSLFAKAPIIYNNLPKAMRTTEDLGSFKRQLQSLLVTKCYYSVNEFLSDKLHHDTPSCT